MLLNHVRLIGELSGGTAAEDGAVEIKDGKISKVYEQAVTGEPEGFDDEMIDCRGKTLLPGTDRRPYSFDRHSLFYFGDDA